MDNGMRYLCSFEFFLILELQLDGIVRRQAHGIDDHHRAFQYLQGFVDLIARDTLIGLREFLRAAFINRYHSLDREITVLWKSYPWLLESCARGSTASSPLALKRSDIITPSEHLVRTSSVSFAGHVVLFDVTIHRDTFIGVLVDQFQLADLFLRQTLHVHRQDDAVLGQHGHFYRIAQE